MRKIFAVILSVCTCVLLGACGEQTAEKDYEGFEGVLDFGAYSGASQIVDDETAGLKEEMEGEELSLYWYSLESLGSDTKPEEVFFGYIHAMENLGFDSSYDREQEGYVLAHLMNESFLISLSWDPTAEEVFVMLGPAESDEVQEG